MHKKASFPDSRVMDQPFLSNSHVAGVTPALPGGPFIRKLCLFIMFGFYSPAAGSTG